MLLPDTKRQTPSKNDHGIVYRIDTGMFNHTYKGKEMARRTVYDEKDPRTVTGEKVSRAITDFVLLGSTKHLVSLVLCLLLLGHNGNVFADNW